MQDNTSSQSRGYVLLVLLVLLVLAAGACGTRASTGHTANATTSTVATTAPSATSTGGATEPSSSTLPPGSPTSTGEGSQPGTTAPVVGSTTGGSVQTPTSTNPPVTGAVGPPPTTAEPATTPTAAIDAAYQSYLYDISALDDDFASVWLHDLQLVAVTSLVEDAAASASVIRQTDEHGVGTLLDANRKVVVTGTTASLSDCLDETHWYIVSVKTGEPDPGVARGYFKGTGTLVYKAGKWYVSTWNSESTTCTF